MDGWMDVLTNKWSNSRRENRTALHNEGHSSSDKNGDVTRDPTEWKWKIWKHKHTQQSHITNRGPHAHTFIALEYARCAPLTGVKDLLDDSSNLSLQHGVEQLDDEN